jgi:hypothetical protein
MNTLRKTVFAMSAILLVGIPRASSQASGCTNGLPENLLSIPIQWGLESNGMRAGASLYVESEKIIVTVSVLGSASRQGKGYLAPPDHKFLRLELTGSNGLPVSGRASFKAMQGTFPAKMPTKDFPMTARTGVLYGRSAMFKDPLLIGPESPYPLRQFNLLDVFAISDGGNYALTVWPAVYHIGTNALNADRIDLPPVTIPVRVVLQGKTPP